MGSIVISEAFLFSIYAITRIPVNSLTMPLAVILFVLLIIEVDMWHLLKILNQMVI